jgi:hypothetical protein
MVLEHRDSPRLDDRESSLSGQIRFELVCPVCPQMRHVGGARFLLPVAGVPASPLAAPPRWQLLLLLVAIALGSYSIQHGEASPMVLQGLAYMVPSPKSKRTRKTMYPSSERSLWLLYCLTAHDLITMNTAMHPTGTVNFYNYETGTRALSWSSRTRRASSQ